MPVLPPPRSERAGSESGRSFRGDYERQELTGVVREVNARVVQLGGLSGREFFDAVVPLEAVDAVLVRTKE